LASGYISRAISSAMTTLNVSLTAVMGKRPSAFQLNMFKLFNRSSNYFMFVWPSYLAIILQSVVMVVAGMSFASEYHRPANQSTVVQSGYSPLLVLTTKLVPYWLLSFVLLGFYGIYFYLFRQPMPEHPGRISPSSSSPV
jgi:hypothetical protein